MGLTVERINLQGFPVTQPLSPPILVNVMVVKGVEEATVMVALPNPFEKAQCI
jgi:hypothetical protein